jgi:hypothetical protein
MLSQDDPTRETSHEDNSHRNAEGSVNGTD